MKAAVYHRYGPANVVTLTERPVPTPKPGEVLVRVHVSAVTRADTMIREGTPRFGRLFLGLRGPKVTAMGTQFAGEIIKAGSEVTNFSKGDRVFGETGLNFGAHAEYAVVEAKGVIAKIPAGMTDHEAAALCDGPLTDMNFLRNLADLQPGQHILINGAAGSLGSAAVQLARSFGAEVTGVCSTRNVAFVKSLGADHVIDYNREDFTKRRGTYDVIYDTVGKSSFKTARPALTPEGQFISPVLSLRLLGQMLFGNCFRKQKAKFSASGMLPPEQLMPLVTELTDRIALGHLKMVVDRKFPLSRIGEAHAYVDTGHKRGNVIIEMDAA